MSTHRSRDRFSDRQADALLQGLVERYSPSTHEQDAVAFLVEQMESLGFQAHVDGAGNAVGEMGSGSETILLLGHIDTVRGQIPVRRQGTLLYGRGTVDAKGPLASFVAAVARTGPLPGKRFVVVGAVEEEAATSKGARFLLDRLTPAAVVIGEPSGWDQVTNGYKGRLLADIEYHQEIAHTAGPHKSVCEQAVDCWTHIARETDNWNADRPRVFDQITPSLRSMHSDSNGFVETARLTVGFRLPPAIDVDDVERQVCEWAKPATTQFRGREIAFRASRSTPLARAFVRAIHGLGQRACFKVKSGTSDMNVVGPVWRCPIVAYGPGDSTLDHTPHEHIDLDEYHRAIEVLTHVLTLLQ